MNLELGRNASWTRAEHELAWTRTDWGWRREQLIVERELLQSGSRAALMRTGRLQFGTRAVLDAGWSWVCLGSGTPWGWSWSGGHELERSRERIRVRRYRRVRIRVPKQIGAHCICAWGRVGGQIDKRFALTDSSRPGLRFDILIVFWVLTVWENGLFEVPRQIPFHLGF